jgi:hypothetical protein
MDLGKLQINFIIAIADLSSTWKQNEKEGL